MSKLNNIITTPLYKDVLPSSGKKVTFRPIVVKEERALLAAAESEDPSVMLATLVAIVHSAISENVTLTSYDVEYMFLKIRAKSVGEISSLMYKCSECGTEHEVQINIEQVSVDGTPGGQTIVVSEDLSFIMKEPSIEEIMEISSNSDSTTLTRDTILSCIEKIAYKDELIDPKEETASDIIAFIDRLTGTQFAMLKNYIESRPKLKLEKEWVCPECNHKNTEVLTGIYDFF